MVALLHINGMGRIDRIKTVLETSKQIKVRYDFNTGILVIDTESTHLNGIVHKDEEDEIIDLITPYL